MISIFKNIKSNKLAILDLYVKQDNLANILSTKDWVTLYSTNFSNMIEIVNDSGWNAVNAENAEFISVDSNFGIKIKTNKSKSDWFGNIKSSPGVSFNLCSVFDILDCFRISQYKVRVICCVDSVDSELPFEQTVCGVEIASALPENNFSAYCINGANGDGKLYAGPILTLQNKTTEDISSCKKEQNNFVCFELDGKDSLVILYGTSEQNLTQVAKIKWNNVAKSYINSYSDFNFCFMSCTGDKCGNQISFLKHFSIMVKQRS